MRSRSSFIVTLLLLTVAIGPMVAFWPQLAVGSSAATASTDERSKIAESGRETAESSRETADVLSAPWEIYEPSYVQAIDGQPYVQESQTRIVSVSDGLSGDPSQGPRNPTAATDYVMPYQSTVWTNPTNVFTQNSGYATLWTSTTPHCPDGWPGVCGNLGTGTTDSAAIVKQRMLRISGPAAGDEPSDGFNIYRFHMYVVSATATSWYMGLYTGAGVLVARTGIYATSASGWTTFTPTSTLTLVSLGTYWISYTKNMVNMAAYDATSGSCEFDRDLATWDTAWTNFTPSCSYTTYVWKFWVDVDYGVTRRLDASGYGFTIPSYAVISGIFVQIYRYSQYSTTDLFTADGTVKLLDNTAMVGSNLAKTGYSQRWQTSNTQVQYGFGTGGHMWGLGQSYWTPAKINHVGFGVSFTVISRSKTQVAVNIYVDWIAVTVIYVYCRWPAATGGPQSAASSPYNWQQYIVQQGPPTATVGCIGQRQITSTAPAGNTRAYIWYYVSTGELYIVVYEYGWSGAIGGAVIWTSSQWGKAQGVVISDLVASGGYVWAVVASQNNAGTGVQFAVIKITESTGPTVPPVVVVVGTYGTTYAVSSEYHSVILDVQLFEPYAKAYMSYSYTDSIGLWNTENVQLSTVFTTPSCGAANDQAVNWIQPVAAKFAYSTYNMKIYGVYGMVYIQTYETGKGAAIYDYTTMTAPTPVTITVKYPASPLTVMYDPEYKALFINFFTSDAKVDEYTYFMSGSTDEKYPNNPYGSSLTDCLDIVGSANGYGQWIIMGLWNSGYASYRYTLDYGMSWSGWINAPSGYNNYLAEYINMPTYFQPVDFVIGKQGFGSYMEMEAGWWILRTFQYVTVAMTFTGTQTLTGVSTHWTTSQIPGQGITTVSGTQTRTATTITYETSDLPITVMAYAIMIILAPIGLAVALQKSVLALLIGAMLGVSMASALSLIPIWMLIVVLIGVVTMLILSRVASGGGVEQ